MMRMAISPLFAIKIFFIQSFIFHFRGSAILIL
jgi:hypothetical protein